MNDGSACTLQSITGNFIYPAGLPALWSQHVLSNLVTHTTLCYDNQEEAHASPPLPMRGATHLCLLLKTLLNMWLACSSLKYGPSAKARKSKLLSRAP